MKLLYDLSFLKEETPDFVIFDLETTGLSNRTDRIVEIGAIRYSGGEITGTMDLLVDPEMKIPSVASSIHGIYDRDVKGKPTIDKILPEFLDLIQDSVLVAHNASFDVGFIKKALGRAEMKVPEIRVLDTIRLSKKAWPGRKSYSQQNLASFLDIHVRKAHRAEDDCRVCLEILKKGIEKVKAGENIE